MNRLAGAILFAVLAAASVHAQTIPAELQAQIDQGNIPADIQQQIKARLASGATGNAAVAATPREDSTAVPTGLQNQRTESSPDSSASQSEPESPSLPAERLPFGYDIFRRASATFSPIDFGPVDADYRVGTGDEIVIDTWGGVELHYNLTVDRNGAISLPVAGRLVVSGLTVDELQSRIRSHLARYHESLRPGAPGSKTYLSVGLGRLRPITVFVLGEVERPGSYTLGAASTMFHALYASGGPRRNGSLRNVVRLGADGSRDTLDVYDYLIDGDRSKDTRLSHLDVVLVPVVGRTVSVRGAIRRPAQFELLPNDSLKSVLRFAGGLRADATPEYSQIERIVGSERRLIDVDLTLSPAPVLHDGDMLTVGVALRDTVQTITAAGEVRRQGRYGWSRGMTIRDLVKLADGPTEDAYLDQVEIVRKRADGATEVRAANLRRIMSGDRLANVVLEPYDKLLVRSVRDFAPSDSVTVHGEVRQPGRFPYRHDITLRDLMFEAGGLTPAAYTQEIEIVRQYLTGGQVYTDTLAVPIAVPPNAADNEISDWPEFPIRPHDHVFVRTRPDWQAPITVRIEGQVKFPGAYRLMTRSERLVDLVERAGGLTELAYVPGIHVARPALGRIATDYASAAKNPESAENLVLMEKDVVRVPVRPQTVKIKGAVGLETNVIYEPGKDVGYYLELAGGVLDSADVDKIQVIQFNGRIKKAKDWWFWTEVDPGATISVPYKRIRPETDWGTTIRDAVTFIGALATTALLIIQVMNN